MPHYATARCLNTTTGVVLGSSTGQPVSNQSVVCDATSTTSNVVSAGPNSSNVSVTVLPGAIVSPGVRAIGVVNNSTVLNQGDIRTGANNSFGITSTGSGSTLTNSGTITTTGPNGYGLDARGSNSTLINNGTITTSGSDSAGVRTTETTAGTLIQNGGTINVTGPSSSQNGAGVVFQAGAAGTFINTASGNVTSAGDAGIRGANANITIQNAGNLTGGNGDAIILGNGNNTIQMTAGHLTGSVLSGTGNNHFLLSGGLVSGDVVFGSGNNVFSLAGGMITGSLNVGGGNNTVSLYTGATVMGAIVGGAGTNALTLDGSGTGSYAGALSNFQTLTKQNTGSWTLSGSVANLTSIVVNGGSQTLSGVAGTYTGATVAGGANLVLTNAASLAGSSGIIDNGSFSVVGNGNTSIAALSGTGGATLGANRLTVSSGTFTGTLGATGDTGGLTKTGTGTFTFAGGAYSGATNVMQGTLIQTGATANAATVSIAAGATLQAAGAHLFGSNAIVNDMGIFVLNNHDQTIGALTGNGIVQLGTGTLTYTAANSTFAGNLVGTGGFIKAGSSTFTVAGTSTYSGDTQVNGGIFNVTGSLNGSNVIVNNGGVLSGSGTIVDPTINAGGTLAPGAVNGTPTTLTVDSLTFMPGSFYNVIVTPAAGDRTIVTGPATINGGIVQVFAGTGAYSPQSRYNILASASGVIGTFSGVTSNLAFLMPTLVYDRNDVTLVLSRNDLSFAGVAATANQRAAATGLTNASRSAQGAAGGAILNAIYNTSVPQAQAAFDGLSGEGIASAQNVAYRSSTLFASSIADQTVFYGAGAANSVTPTGAPPPLAYVATRTPNSPIVTRDTALLPSRTWRAWATGFGAGEKVHSDANLGTAMQTNSVFGGSMGVDYQFTPDYLAGVALGGTDGSFSVPGRGVSGSTTGGHAAFYTLVNFGPFYGAGTTSFSYFGNKTTRNIAGFGGVAGETERGNFGSREFRSRSEFGWHAGMYGATLTPFVALEIAQLRSNGFTEGELNGAGLLALNVQGQSSASVPAYLGARLSRSFLLDDGMIFTPTIQAAYLHEFAPQRSLVAGLVNLPGSTFLVDGARASSDAVQVKAGAELTLTANLRASATFDGEFSGVEQVYAGKGGLRYSW